MDRERYEKKTVDKLREDSIEMREGSNVSVNVIEKWGMVLNIWIILYVMDWLFMG